MTRARKTCLITAASCFIFMAASHAENDMQHHEYPPSGADLNCKLGFDSLKVEILAIDGLELHSSNNEFESFAEPASYSTYVFTKLGHYAHPMIVKRKVIEETGAIMIRTTGCGYGSKRNSDRLMKEFGYLNEQIAEEFDDQE